MNNKEKELQILKDKIIDSIYKAYGKDDLTIEEIAFVVFILGKYIVDQENGHDILEKTVLNILFS